MMFYRFISFMRPYPLLSSFSEKESLTMLKKGVLIVAVLVQISRGHLVEPEDELNQILRSYKFHQRPKDINQLDKNGNRSVVAVMSSAHPPLTVDVSMEISIISAINILHMDMTLVFTLFQRWYDTRLKLTSTEADEMVSIGAFRDSIWLPDLYFRNAKVTNRHLYPRPNQLIWLRGSDGQVIYSQKITGTFNCHMKLWNFPFDKQICRVEMGSYGYSTVDLKFRWWSNQSDSHQGACLIASNMPNNEYHQPLVRLRECVSKYYSTGTFSCIAADIVLQRQFGFYLTFSYFPSFLIILVNWIQFMIDPAAVPARVTLGLLSVLALITQKAATAAQLPRVSYVKAIDVWFVGCLGLVVLSLMEFAIINRNRMKQQKSQKLQRISTEEEEEEEETNENQATSWKKLQNFSRRLRNVRFFSIVPFVKSQQPKYDLDRICLYLYPVVFFIFNVIYWSYYLSPL